LIREVRVVAAVAPEPKAEVKPRREWVPIGYAVLALVVAISVLTMSRNPINLIPLPFNESPTVDSFKRLVSNNRIETIDQALYQFFLRHRRFAPSLDDLVTEGFLAEGSMADPWGRFYAYEIFPAGYRVVGFDNGGVEDPSLSRARRFPTGILPGESPSAGSRRP